MVVTPLVSIGTPLIKECLFLLTSELFKIIIIKSKGVMAFWFLSIFQHNGFCVGVTILPPLPWPSGLVLVFVILVFAVLLPFGCGLLCPLGVFVVIMSVWMLPEDFLLQFSHGIKAGVIWIPCSSVDAGMHVVKTWIFDLAEQVLNLGLFICDSF